MKKYLSIAILVLIFSFQSLTKAEDITEFEIEGMSIGDSLLDYMSKSFIDKDKEALYPNKKYLTSFYEHKSKDYDDIQIDFLANDPKYIIAGIEAKKYFSNDIAGCLLKQKIISQSIIEIVNRDYAESSKPHRADKSGKSMNYFNAWWFDDGSTLQVYCTDWSEETGYIDELKVSASSNEIKEFILNEAYDE